MDKREQVARSIQAVEIPEGGWPQDKAGVWLMALEEAAKAADAAVDEIGGARVKPLVWECHPVGTIAAPPTGHAYIIDTRMKGRVHSIKGFNPQREFVSLDEAKAAAQADYEARILAALEPVTVRTLTADECVRIVEATEPAEMTDVGDTQWTRRMGEALARALAEK